MQPDYSPIWGVLLVTAILLALGFRPRRPWVIHAHMNRMFIKVALSIWVIFGLAWLSVIPIIELSLPSWTVYIVALLTILLLIFSMVYVLYWSHPFSRKRTGVAVVDEAVERYKKPREQVVGIIGGWCPDLVVDGEPYKLISYFPRRSTKVTGMLAFDLQGNVIRDESLMHKIAACMRLAGQCANPDEINARAAIYTRIDKAVPGIEKIRPRFVALARFLESEVELATAVKDILELLDVMKQDFTLYKSYLEEEAKECNSLGGTQARKIPYESVEKLNELWKTNRDEWEEEILSNLPKWKRAVETLRSALRKQSQFVHKDLLYMVEKVFPEYFITYETPREWKEAGDRFPKIQPREIGAWHSRLEWVDLVDGWIAQGLSGKALEAQKQAYLAEQARLEKERRREERRRRREELRREREERERRRAAAQAGVDPEQQN